MTLREAINTGKKFKRPHHCLFMTLARASIHCGDFKYDLTVTDALAEDWMIEQKQIVITELEFFNAIADGIKQSKSTSCYDTYGYYEDAIERAAKILFK